MCTLAEIYANHKKLSIIIKHFNDRTFLHVKSINQDWKSETIELNLHVNPKNIIWPSTWKEILSTIVIILKSLLTIPFISTLHIKITIAFKLNTVKPSPNRNNRSLQGRVVRSSYNQCNSHQFINMKFQTLLSQWLEKGKSVYMINLKRHIFQEVHK